MSFMQVEEYEARIAKAEAEAADAKSKAEAAHQTVELAMAASKAENQNLSDKLTAYKTVELASKAENQDLSDKLAAYQASILHQRIIIEFFEAEVRKICYYNTRA